MQGRKIEHRGVCSERGVAVFVQVGIDANNGM